MTSQLPPATPCRSISRFPLFDFYLLFGKKGINSICQSVCMNGDCACVLISKKKKKKKNISGVTGVSLQDELYKKPHRDGSEILNWQVGAWRIWSLMAWSIWRTSQCCQPKPKPWLHVFVCAMTCPFSFSFFFFVSVCMFVSTSLANRCKYPKEVSCLVRA